MPDCLAERVGLTRSLCVLVANMPLRGCVGRTGFSSSTTLGENRKKGSDLMGLAPFSILAVERVWCGACSPKHSRVLLGMPSK